MDHDLVAEEALPAARAPRAAASRPTGAHQRASDERLAWATATLLGVVGLVAKSPQALTLPQFWAEDGRVFFADQHGHQLPQLLEPYAGYLLAVPRLVAWAASLLPTSAAPLLYNVAAIVIGAMCIASLRVLGRWGLSFALVLGSVLLTPTNGEVFGTLTNVQWFMQFYLVACIVRILGGPPSTRPWARAAVMVPVALTGPLGMMATGALAVGAGARWAHERRAGRTWRLVLTPEVAVLAVCSAVQAVVLVRFPPTGEQELRFTAAAVKDLAASVQPHLFGRVVVANELFLLGCVGLTALAALRFRGSPAGQRAAFAAFLAFVVAQFAATVPKARGSALVQLGAGDRYFVLAKVAFWWLVGLALIALWGRVALANVAALLGLVVAAVVLSHPLQRQRFPDLDWPRYAAEIDDGADVTVAIWPPGWFFRCAPDGAGDSACWATTGPP